MKSPLQEYKFFHQLKKLPFVQKIILYGSRARGDFQKRSDIDLAIICPDAQESDWRVVLDIIENADTLLSIDCVRLDTLDKDNPLKEAIMKDGIVLYQQGKT